MTCPKDLITPNVWSPDSNPWFYSIILFSPLFSAELEDSSCRLWIAELHLGVFVDGTTASWLRREFCSQADWVSTLAPLFTSWDLVPGAQLLHGWASSSEKWQVGSMKSQLLHLYVPSTSWQWAHESPSTAWQERHNRLGWEAYEGLKRVLKTSQPRRSLRN